MGYNSIKQFIEDYKLYLVARKIDPGRDGETITSFLKKRIDKRLANATNHFNDIMKKRGYSKTDLMLIATHDSLKYIHNLEFFVRECFGAMYINKIYYKKILSSNAFKTGRLRRLNDFIPNKIETKTEFLRFVRSRRGIPKDELCIIMNYICGKKWRIWLDELIEKGKITEHESRWFA